METRALRGDGGLVVNIKGMNFTVWIPAKAGMEIREGRIEVSAQKRDK